MALTLRRLCLLLGLAARSVAGPLDAPHQELLGARAAGMGGAEVATAGDLEAVVYNPAGLPSEGLHLGAFGGLDPARRGQAGFGLSAPLDDALRLGFFAGGLQDDGLNALQVQTLALAAAAELQPGLSLGLRGQWRQVQAPVLDGPLRRASLDFGVQARALRIPGIPGPWALGLSLDHVLGFWQDADPLTGRFGLSYRPWARLSLGVQSDWSSSALRESSVKQTWRGALQWDATPLLALRAGWADDGFEGQLSTGVSLDLKPSLGAGLDYALLSPPGRLSLSHRLSLRWAWAYEARAEMRVEVAQLLRDPDSGVVRSARLDVVLSPLLRQAPWHVDLKDAQGQVWRTLSPVDLEDQSLVWDGLDSQGRASPLPDGLRAELVAQSAKGPLRMLSPLTLEDSARQQEMARSGEALPGPSFKPVFEDAGGKELSHVIIELPAAKAKSWSLEIVDARQQSLRTLAGQGDLPPGLVWDGRDSQGRKVADVLSVQVSLQVLGPQGRQAVQRLPLFSQKAFAFAQREVRQRPVLQLATLGLPLFLNRPALAWQEGFLPALSKRARQRLAEAPAPEERRLSGEEMHADPFASGSAELSPRSGLLPMIEDRLKVAEPRNSTLWVRGLAKKGEPEPELLARQRAVSLARGLRSQGEGIQLVLEAPGSAAELKGLQLGFRAATVPEAQGLAQAGPESLRARYHPIKVPDKLGLDPPPMPSGPWRLWITDPGAKAPMAWCPATAKLAFFQDGWIWVTDAQGSRLRTLWFDPGLAAAGQLAWSPDGSHLWIRADQWRGWRSLQVELER